MMIDNLILSSIRQKKNIIKTKTRLNKKVDLSGQINSKFPESIEIQFDKVNQIK